MSKIKNCGLDQYGAEPFEQQQFETAGVEGVNETIHYYITLDFQPIANRDNTILHLCQPGFLKTPGLFIKAQPGGLFGFYCFFGRV